MTRRLFSNEPPRIIFTRDFRVVVRGDLHAGMTAKTLYDASRLPAGASDDDNLNVTAFYKFVEQGPVHQVDLQTGLGAIQTKMSNDTAEGNIMVCSIDIPAGVDHLTLWFLGTYASGARYWDSNFGKNFFFRFMVEDFDVDRCEVLPDATKPIAWFQVDLTTAPDVTDIGIDYQVVNQPAGWQSPHEFLALSASGESDTSGNRKWSGSAPVPRNAVIKLAFRYHAWGNEHFDTNSGHGYTTWPGARSDPQAGVL